LVGYSDWRSPSGRQTDENIDSNKDHKLTVKIICISDTHGEHELVNVPMGDVLVHAGDITAHGSKENFLDFIRWFSSLPHEHKIFIGGNHDTFLEEQPEQVVEVATRHGLIYLNDSGVEIKGVQFWGSPITPRFHDWSFMRDEDDIHHHWSLIPDNTQVLVTHGPVWGILDEVERSEELTEHTGCKSLAARVSVVQPRYHVFGHIHEGYGSLDSGKTRYINVSTMNKFYRIENDPVTVNL